jgi:tripartite-type tricarboxylate transporter receptor subunit TctC
VAASLVGAWGLATPAHAQLDPSRTITIVVPVAAGGGVDAIGRLMAEKLQERLKQNVVVENRTGAGGMVGTASVAKAAPDGYTILLTENSSAISKWLNKATPFDVTKDFAPIARVATSPVLLFAHPSVEANDVKELIALAKKKPLSAAIPGVGTPHHLAHLMLEAAAHVKIQLVPYRGTGPGLADVLAGRVPLMWATPVALIPHVKSGKIKALGVASLHRTPSLPQAPTIAENALPGFNLVLWFGLTAPAKTPQAIIDRYAKEVAEIVKLPDVKERTAKLGFELAYAGSDEFRKMIASDYVRYGEAVRAAGIEAK